MNSQDHPGQANPTPSEGPTGDAKDDCLAYLLGEMSQAQRVDFESRLSDPAVADELLRCSETLLAVANTDFSTERNLATDVRRRWPLVAAISALAATLLFSVSLPTDDGDAPENGDTSVELLIAKAWLEQPAIVSDATPDWTDAEIDEPFVTDEPTDDATSWMVAAVAAGENTDG